MWLRVHHVAPPISAEEIGVASTAARFTRTRHLVYTAENRGEARRYEERIIDVDSGFSRLTRIYVMPGDIHAALSRHGAASHSAVKNSGLAKYQNGLAMAAITPNLSGTFRGLHWLMRRLAQEVPLVVYIDDVQWGDADAASFLADLVLHPEAPTMLLVASCRLEEEENSLLVQALRQRRPAGNGEVREMTLAGFTPGEADELVTSMRGSDGRRSDVDILLRESRCL